MPNFDEYLSIPVGEISIKVLPEGHYAARVKNWEAKESSGQSGKGKKPMVMVQFTVDSAYEDVTAEALDGQKVEGRTISNNYMLDQDFGRVQLKELVIACGIPMDDSQGLGVYLPQIANQPVKLFINQRSMGEGDEQRQIENVKKVLPAQ